MLRITTKINDELIDIREFAKPNACFQTNEYPDNYDFCILHERFNPYDLFNDNKIKEKEIERLNNIINELKQKNNLAENILYDYLYNDDKITKEKYKQFKELKGGK